MHKRKLVITHSLDQTLIDKIANVIPEWEIVVGKEKSSWENAVKDAEIVAGWKTELEALCLKEPTPLRWVQSWSAGVNSMPLEKLSRNKIMLTSANGVHAYPISETIFAFMLGLTRKIHTYVNNQQTKTWDHSNLKSEMHRKTVGIIGVGEIGKETAKIAKAFSMKVIGIRYSGKSERYVDEMYRPEELNLILPRCDYLVVTLPLTADTRRLFRREQFELMKPSSFFINIGRGEVVNESDLIAALQAGEIAGAGLDVFATEPLSSESPLWGMENVIITPHTSGSTEHYHQRLIETIFLPNLKDYMAGKPPAINAVDYSKGY
ncbi:Phosphoglycerate dehydrogenase [Evansella caseinilytica]|uniref:Phosphoglycerate dehydrogenase n=1 Tax=Evansella caseinilytica TaxID=1503961 RepID=A0A1H3IZG0_9BACI|nr:D-2-hydroxyacid dehydrogenase [Evansella caseinilytica]SDY32568.1 Phosphoglycerate dehydrogenase [Evansella caseinilytica]